MANPTFRIRSIYDIPLVKLIVDELNYVLVQPLPEQAHIFKFEDKLEPHDIEINDVLDGYGISIEGDEEYVSAITNILQKKIPNIICLQHPVQLHAIYNGKIIHVNHEKNLSVVDIGENINAILFGSHFHKGQNVVVQIKQLNIFEDQLPVCSTVIHFPGQSVILERDANFVRVSRKLPKTERDKLFLLGKQLRPKGHGLIMRTSATKASSEIIQADIDQLIQRAEELDLLISGSSYGPGILQPGVSVSHVIFVKIAKEKLTEIRHAIVPTIPLYHWFMSYSPELKITATFAEKLSEDVSREKLSTLLRETLLERDFSENAIIYIQEYNLTSPLQERVLGQLNWKNEVLEIKRSFRSSRGYHFGIQEEIQQGDSSIVYVEEGSWTVHIKFFRQEQSLGEIVKIVTPLELANAGRIKYINLGLMLIKRGESVKVVDEGLITSLAEKEIISNSFKEGLYILVEKAKKKLEKGEEQILLDFN
ncbi:MAG: ribonuclease E/G [Candidatus Heimdallarchaeaceae archaeon]